MLTDSDVVQQSQHAENLETDFDAEPTQDGNSENGNVAMEPKYSSDVSISSTEDNSPDYIGELSRSNIPALEFWKLCNFDIDTT